MNTIPKILQIYNFILQISENKEMLNFFNILSLNVIVECTTRRVIIKYNCGLDNCVDDDYIFTYFNNIEIQYKNSIRKTKLTKIWMSLKY